MRLLVIACAGGACAGGVLVGCGGASIAPRELDDTLQPHATIVEHQWTPKRMPALQPRQPHNTIQSLIIIPHLGPNQGPTPSEDLDTLEKVAANAKGTAKLIALDRLADAIEDHAGDVVDDPQRELERAAATYQQLIAAPGFAHYPTADDVLFRAAHALLFAGKSAEGRELLHKLMARSPSSPLVADVYVLLGNDVSSGNPAEARVDYELALQTARPSLVDYIHLQHASVLADLGEGAAALAELEVVAAAQPDWRNAVAASAVRAYAKTGAIGDVRDYFTRIAPVDADDYIARLVGDFIDAGRDTDAINVLGETIANAANPEALCEARGRMFLAKRRYAPRADLLAEARAFVDATAGTGAECHADADDQLGQLAFAWQNEQHDIDARDVDRMWQLELEVVTLASRRAIALRDRAYVLWQIAQRGRRLDPKAWRAAAVAFDAAFDAARDPMLAEAASAARHNAAVVERR